MNDFDAEKQNMNDQKDNRVDTNNQQTETNPVDHVDQDHMNPQPSEGAGYTFIHNGSPTGRGYTTPEGGHGFVYTPPVTPMGNGVGKKLIIAFSVLAFVILLMGVCFLGAWSIARSGNQFSGYDHPNGVPEESYEPSDTAGGFIIMDENQEASAETTGNSGPEENSGNIFADREPPKTATIQKNQSQKEDADGDGKADIAFDPHGQVITSAGDRGMTVPTVVTQVAASVVEISTETLVQPGGWSGSYITAGAGSGVIIAKEGYIITNHHVIANADTIVVRLNDGTEFRASLVGTDEATDLAILWIDPGAYNLTVAALGSSYDLVAGEDILAIGNPLGSLGGTVTEGIVSATERQISVDGHTMTLLQVSAPINPGNSGGGLFNMAGELVGIVNAKMSSEEIEGLGFAIPSDVAYLIACELIEHRYVRGRVDTGLVLLDVNSIKTAWDYFRSTTVGVYVYDSVSDVLQYGDRILTVNGEGIGKSSDISAILQGARVGDSVEFVVNRNGTEVTVTLVLMEYVPDYLKEESVALSPSA